MHVLLQSVDHLLRLFYPALCLACQDTLPQSNMQLCLDCQTKLPYTTLHEDVDNLFTQRFWGRVRVQSGAACFYFVKGGKIQQVIHHLKYSHKPYIGFHWGKIYAQKLAQEAHFRTVDLVIPVPLHWKKQQLRGYNQAEAISRGLAEGMEKLHIPKALIRNEFSSSQTQKGKLDRLNNVEQAFSVARPAELEGRHVLLVDDVMTSGATLEACALPILALSGTKVSMVTLAMAL
jgi:ComF family protein